jgi:site-specific DNA-methyltransferase (adenine-specific)
VRVGPVVERPLSSLHASEQNPRFITPESLERLMSTMETEREMLQARPLLALPDGTVFGGNQRLLAAIKLGWETIPVITVEGLSETQLSVWGLLDNQEFGEWDRPALAQFLAKLLGQGVDPILTGFKERELDEILAGLDRAADPEEIPPVPPEPSSQPGELYTLGQHDLLCGDSTDPEQLARVIAGREVAALVTDFPWGVDYQGKTPEALTIENDSAAGLPEFLAAAFGALDRVLGPRVPFYLFVPSGPAGTEFRLALRSIGWEHRQTLIWCKNTLVLGHSDYHYRHEEILYGFTPGPGRAGRGGGRGSHWYGGNDQSSVLFFDRPKSSPEHPTSKPVALMAALIRNSTRRGELVLDPFAGSGSTLLACETLGRRCAAVELDPRYADVIRTRYQAYRGDE